jgi:hypothetical protein
MSYDIMIGYDFYDHFTMEHFTLRQSMILTTSFFFARDSMYNCEDKSGFTKSDKNITTKLKTFI